MMLLFVLVAIAVIAGIALASVGRLGELPEAPVDRRPAEVGFDVVLRGYRMDEVDAELADLRARLAAHEKGA
ncbi:MAG: DivIVA domain-containing protein [Actinomycetes bacterium]